METLLISINAKFIHTNNAVRSLKANCDFKCDIAEYTIKDSVDTIVSMIETSSYDVIGFSVYIWNVEIVKHILTSIKSDKIIVLGGPEVSYEPDHFLKFNQVDYVIKGEGELTFNQLLHSIKDQNLAPDIPSIAYLKEDQLVNTPIEEIRNLEILKAPYFFKEDIEHIPNRIAYIESSRGCPYNCSYCLSSLEKTVRFFNINNVKKAIDYYLEHGAKTIKFLDRTFNANKKTMDIFNYIIEKDNGIVTFQFEITGDTLSPKIVELIHQKARKGLFRFEIGIQSTNYQTNRLVNRIQDNDKLFSIIESIIKADIITLHLDLIAGLPKEDKASFIHTFNEVFIRGAKELQLGFLKLLRGTLLKKQADLFGMIYHTDSPYEIIKTDVLSIEDIKEIHLVEHMLEIYHNKGYFGKNLLDILIHKPSPYHFFLELGQDYLKNNYDLHRYQLEDVYLRLFNHLSPKEQYLIKQDYLMRSTIKPKDIFKETIDKQTKKELLEKISNTYNIQIRLLYKHTRIIQLKGETFVVYYKGEVPIAYTI